MHLGIFLSNSTNRKLCFKIAGNNPFYGYVTELTYVKIHFFVAFFLTDLISFQSCNTFTWFSVKTLTKGSPLAI